MADGRIPENTAFLSEIQQFYGAKTPHDLIWAVNGADSREKIAGCARTVFAMADRGDPTAEELVAQSARELTLLIETTRKKAGGERWPVVLSGGLAASMLPRLKHLGDVRLLSVSPAAAAAAIALHRAGLPQAAQQLLKEGAAT
jgi:N-acetylglucosamine kinase-like BadF-type ATPase